MTLSCKPSTSRISRLPAVLLNPLRKILPLGTLLKIIVKAVVVQKKVKIRTGIYPVEKLNGRVLGITS
jgi:hypothetical protein